MDNLNTGKLKHIIGPSGDFIHNGWSNATKLLYPSHSGGITLFTFFDTFFQEAVSKRTGGWKPNVILRKLQRNSLNHAKWMAMIHDPVDASRYLPVKHSHGELWHKFIYNFMGQEKTDRGCYGLFFMNQQSKHDYKQLLTDNGLGHIPCETLTHPIQQHSENYNFNWAQFENHRHVVQSGYTLRRVSSIFNLCTLPKYTKVITPFDDRTKSLLVHELGSKTAWADYQKTDPRLRRPVEYQRATNYSTYLKRYTNSVMYLNLYNVTACNVILDCISTCCPLIINRLSGVEEYLGSDYPLLYESEDEASYMLHNDDLLYKAHEYLKQMDKTRFTPEHFTRQFINSEAYKNF